MPPLAILAVGAVVILRYAATWFDRGQSARKTPLPPEVLHAVAALQRQQATPLQLRNAALVALRGDQPRLGAALLDQAKLLERTTHKALAVAKEPTTKQLEALYHSPLPQADDVKWNVYVRRSRTARPNAHSEWNRWGMFQFSARELADAGVMVEAHKGTYQGHKSIWIGKWAPGYDEVTFLALPSLQHEALASLARLHARVIEARHADYIGREVDGAKITMSGLLAVARRAGLGGLSSWVTSVEDREGFPETTAAFQRLNGIF